MSKKVDQFLAKTLGEDFFESLAKVELWKPGTRTTIDHEEIKTALQIVPHVVLALLESELIPMAIGETKELNLPFAPNAMVRITKHERDVYSGEVEQDHKRIVDFKHRSLPGVGLVIMSAFELYDMSEKKTPHKDLAEDADKKIAKLIDERLALHRLVEDVVDGKLRQRDAVSQILLAKLTEALRAEKKPEPIVPAPAIPEVSMMMSEPKAKKQSPVKAFLEKRKKPKEFVVEMAKGENVHCPDCGKNIFDGTLYAGCICLGDDMDRKVFMKKTEDGIKFRFARGWDPENIEMVLEVLRKKNG